jgi:hypothetical protein
MTRWCVLCCTLAVASASADERGPIEMVSPPLAGFFAKRTFEGKIPILGHASVSDEALLAARDRLHRMLAAAPKLRANLEAAHHELHVVGLRQFTSDLPEHRQGRGRRIDTGELFDWHMIGGHIEGRMSSYTEGTLLPIVGHRLFGDETCYHELAHAIEWLALDNRVRGRILDAYHRSLAAGHWKDQYAAKNQHEWFAEMTKLYFRPGGDALAFYDLRLSHGRDWLRGEDPEAFRLVDEIYGGRLDPGTPRTVALPLRPGRDELSLKSIESRIPVRFIIHNDMKTRIHVVWLDFQGRRDPRRPFAELPAADPGQEVEQFTWATHPWVVTDEDGRALCTFVLGADDGQARVAGPCP